MAYDDLFEARLGHEPLLFLRAPYHSPTDQLIIFRGVAITPDWHLATSRGERLWGADEPAAVKRKTFERIERLQARYQVHSWISVHGDGVVRTGFQSACGLTLEGLD